MRSRLEGARSSGAGRTRSRLEGARSGRIAPNGADSIGELSSIPLIPCPDCGLARVAEGRTKKEGENHDLLYFKCARNGVSLYAVFIPLNLQFWGGVGGGGGAAGGGRRAEQRRRESGVGRTARGKGIESLGAAAVFSPYPIASETS